MLRTNPPFCLCGCGNKALWNAARKRWNSFIHNHHFRLEEYREPKELVRQRMLGNKLGPGRKWTPELREEYAKGQIGSNNPNWKGGIYKNCNGYLLQRVPERGYVMQHRLVMEEKLGRRLTLEEVVHHIDGNRENNRHENLLLFANHSQHLIWEKGKKRISELGSSK